MLSKESLSQLKGLKSQMEAEKERTEAVVKGTASRYGFAVVGDGREIFIPPQEMLKAFPGDRVNICIRPTKDDKTVADIEKLVDSPLENFTGRCVRKGKAMFVEPDLPQLNRWLFLPPHARNGAKEGDYLQCAILRHPIRDGKPQAKVLKVLGNDNTPGIENLYCMAKYQISEHWGANSEKELQAILEKNQIAPASSGDRRDFTDLEFVSIDAAKTQDIDDALYAHSSDDGWTLFVAIADPTSVIDPASQLYKDIVQRGTSVYFHGDVVPMMPEALSQGSCALAEDVERAALICKIAISDSGELGDYEFFEATIRSRAKLSYYAVDRYLNGHNDELMSRATPLEALYQVYRVLRAQREEKGLVMEDRQEFRWLLNDEKQIESIEPSEKLLSQKLVEECMVAANRCAALFLAEHKASGPFVAHAGFRGDRIDEARQFLQMHAPQAAEAELNTVDGYRDVMHALVNTESGLPLRGMVNRLLSRAQLTTNADHHMGMAVSAYTNCTSPLRKLVDFFVHLQIKRILSGEQADIATDEMLESLSQRLALSRSATLEADRWLASKYLQKQDSDPSNPMVATIIHVNSAGFHIRLDDCGLEGFVDLRKDAEKFSYDKWTASLTSTTRRFALQQSVNLTFVGIDKDDQYQALFAPTPDCGLKPPKTQDKAADKGQEEALDESPGA